jgi:hypothetical protein
MALQKSSDEYDKLQANQKQIEKEQSLKKLEADIGKRSRWNDIIVCLH